MFSGIVVGIGANVVVFWKGSFIQSKLFYSSKSGSIRTRWLVFGQCGCIRAKVTFIRPIVFCIRRSGCDWAKVVLFGAKWFYAGKMVVFGQKRLYAGNSGCIRAKVVVFGQTRLYSGKSGCVRGKLLVFRQKWLFSGKVPVFGTKLLYSGKLVVFRQK